MQSKDVSPTEMDSSAVVTLTSSNFQAEVVESDRHLLLEFYAPWCGHCKALAPELAKAADELQDHSNIAIAAMDATAHSPPTGFEVKVNHQSNRFFCKSYCAVIICFRGTRRCTTFLLIARSPSRMRAVDQPKTS